MNKRERKSMLALDFAQKVKSIYKNSPRRQLREELNSLIGKYELEQKRNQLENSKQIRNKLYLLLFYINEYPCNKKQIVSKAIHSFTLKEIEFIKKQMQIVKFDPTWEQYVLKTLNVKLKEYE